jgi:hypothetical protein
MKLIPIVGAVVAGMFVGATIAEIIHRIRPNMLGEIESGTKKTFQMIREAFRDGYRGDPAAKAKPKTD